MGPLLYMWFFFTPPIFSHLVSHFVFCSLRNGIGRLLMSSRAVKVPSQYLWPYLSPWPQTFPVLLLMVFMVFVLPIRLIILKCHDNVPMVWSTTNTHRCVYSTVLFVWPVKSYGLWQIKALFLIWQIVKSKLNKENLFGLIDGCSTTAQPLSKRCEAYTTMSYSFHLTSRTLIWKHGLDFLFITNLRTPFKCILHCFQFMVIETIAKLFVALL